MNATLSAIVVFFCAFASGLVAQQVTKLSLPAQATAVNRLAFASDGRLWVSASGREPAGMTLTAPANGNALTVLGGEPLTNTPSGMLFKTFVGSSAVYNGFFPTGTQAMFGEMRGTAGSQYDALYAANAGALSGLFTCKSYSLSDGTKPQLTWGPFPGYDGKLRFSGVDGAGDFRTVKSRLFELDPATCNLTTIAGFAEQNIVQFWPWGNRRFLVESVGKGAPSLGVAYIFSEVMFAYDDGSTTPLISAFPGEKNRVDRCCDLTVDLASPVGLIVYAQQAAPKAAFLKEEKLQEVDLAPAGIPKPAVPNTQYGNEPIARGLALNGRYGLLGSNSLNTNSLGMDRLVLVDRESNTGWTVLTAADLPLKMKFPTPFIYGAASVSSNGDVSFAVTSDDNTPNAYVVHPPLFDTAKVKPGEMFKPTGKNIDGFVFADSPVKCAADGSCAAPNSPSTYQVPGTVRTPEGWTLRGLMPVTVQAQQPIPARTGRTRPGGPERPKSGERRIK